LAFQFDGFLANRFRPLRVNVRRLRRAGPGRLVSRRLSRRFALAPGTEDESGGAGYELNNNSDHGFGSDHGSAHPLAECGEVCG
jgi:hypothetical protein